jgi:hypothetical protein
MTNPTPPLARIKDQARRMRTRTVAKGAPLSQAQALEKLARMLGHRDWNTLHAAASFTPEGAPAKTGDKLRLRYMGIEAEGRLRWVKEGAEQGYWQVAIDLTAPLPIPTAEGIDLTRRRLHADLDAKGISRERRSDGTPHLELLRGR